MRTKLFSVLPFFLIIFFFKPYFSQDCGFEDGDYEAVVKYYNPKTSHTAKYTLTVEVENCEVTIIHFPKGGWLDETHIEPAKLDENGNATVKDDKGRKWFIHIDKPEQ